jgi:hypothetical protein
MPLAPPVITAVRFGVNAGWAIGISPRIFDATLSIAG